MIAIDANALILLMVGLIDPSLKHKRTSIYKTQDLENLLAQIPNLKSLVTLPNVWTEVDNLLNKFSGEQKKSIYFN